MSELVTIAQDLHQSLSQLKAVCKGLNGKRSETIKLRGLLQLIQGQVAELSDVAEEVDVSIKARDETIAALGEKLSQQHQRVAKPFFVPPPLPQNPVEEECSGGVFKPEEDEDWNNQRRMTLQNGMLRELARLSILPMGLEGKEHEEMLEEVVAELRHQNKMSSAEEDVEKAKQEKLRKRALDLIAVSESNNVPREKSRCFLRNKGLTNEFIDKYFSEYDAHRARAMVKRKASPQERALTTHDRTGSQSSIASADSEDSTYMDYMFEKPAAAPPTPVLVRGTSAQAC